MAAPPSWTPHPTVLRVAAYAACFVVIAIAVVLAVELLSGKTPAWDFLDLEIHGGEPLRPDPRETFWPAKVLLMVLTWVCLRRRLSMARLRAMLTSQVVG